jgi:hypothetical protein
MGRQTDRQIAIAIIFVKTIILRDGRGGNNIPVFVSGDV